MPAGPIIGTSQVSLQLTGTSSIPNNFNIEIFAWDITTDLVSTTGRTYASAVSRTATSSLNGGTLLNGYGISGITGTDRYVKLTSTTTCTSNSDLISIESAALTVYTPNSGTLSEYFSAPGNYNSFSVTGIPPGPGHILGSYQILDLTTLSYLTAADFSVQHRTSVYASGGSTVFGEYQYGPFGSFSVVKTGKVYSIFGDANTSYVPENNGVIHSVFRLTYDPTGYYTDFNFYYIPDNV